MSTPDKRAENAAKEFAAALKRMRARQELSQEKLAQAAGLTAAAISQIESGEREPGFSTIVRLAAALKTTPNTLMGLGDGPVDPSLQALFRDASKLSATDAETLKAYARFLVDGKK